MMKIVYIHDTYADNYFVFYRSDLPIKNYKSWLIWIRYSMCLNIAIKWLCKKKTKYNVITVQYSITLHQSVPIGFEKHLSCQFIIPIGTFQTAFWRCFWQILGITSLFLYWVSLFYQVWKWQNKQKHFKMLI